jgi:hypothetical protein
MGKEGRRWNGRKRKIIERKKSKNIKKGVAEGDGEEQKE